MRLFLRRAAICAFFLSFLVAAGCQQREDVARVNLDDRTTDVSQLRKIIDTGDSLTFCFDLRLTPHEDIEIYGSLMDYLAFNLEKEGSIKIIALSDYYPRDGIAVNKDVPEHTAEKFKKALLQFDPLGKHKEELINWSKTEMPGGFTDAEPADYEILRRLSIKYNLLGD